MSHDDRNGLAISLGVHVLVLLLLVFVAATPTKTLEEDYPRPIVEVDLLAFAPTRPVLVGEPQAAVEGAPADAPQQPDIERPAPPAATPVRVPTRTETPRPPRPDPIPRPSPQPDARPTRPNPPSSATRQEPRPTSPQQPNPSAGAGNAQGPGSTSGSGSGPGSGSGGPAAVEVGFQFGNRSFTCPSPPNDGTLTGTINFTVQFAPNGRYMNARPVSRNAPLEEAVRRVISSCRADALPSQADQVPQSTRATFNFVVTN